MLAQKIGDWKKLEKILGRAPKEVLKASKKVILKEGEFFRTKIVEGIRSQAPGGKAFKPLSPTTIAVRQFKGFRGTKALVRTGTLWSSVKVYDSPEGVFIGVHRTRKGKDGKSLVDIATIQEYGSGPIVVQVTPKMRALLMGAFRKAGLAGPYGKGSGIIVTKVPARPFLRPVFEKYGPGTLDRVEKAMIRLLSGTLS